MYKSNGFGENIQYNLPLLLKLYPRPDENTSCKKNIIFNQFKYYFDFKCDFIWLKPTVNPFVAGLNARAGRPVQRLRT